MDKKLLKKLLRKTKLVKFVWSVVSLPLWCADYIQDSSDRNREFRYITGEMSSEYNLKYGVYLYSCNRHKFKLIAVITDRGIKVC